MKATHPQPNEYRKLWMIKLLEFTADNRKSYEWHKTGEYFTT